MITITLAGVPKGKGRPRFGNGRTFTPAATKQYEDALRYAAQETMGDRPLYEGALIIDIEARMPIPQSRSKAWKRDAGLGLIRPITKPDADNLMKVIDALNGVVWRDDAQITDATVRKVYSDKPALVLTIREHGGSSVFD